MNLESITGIYDAFSAALHIGFIDSLYYAFGFSQHSIDLLTARKNYVIGDSLSLSVFLSLLLVSIKKLPLTGVMVTGAIHREQQNFVCNPVAHINQKLLLAANNGFTRTYIPVENFQDVSHQFRNTLELIPLPRKLPELINMFTTREKLS
ncbi:MAG: hypothetical protein Q8N96_15155 [Methylovulum sp.]|nr:hypothetical protein [Methylovulum sp.]